MSEILPLFSKPVYRSSLSQESISYALRRAEEAHYNSNSVSTQDYLIDTLSIFRSEVIDKVNDYIYNFLRIKNSFSYYFPDSWFYKSNPGNISSMHSHSNSLFSGVVYLKTVPNCGDIKFVKEYYFSSLCVEYRIPYEEYNLYNEPFHNITPNSGDILIFPSQLLHSVSVNSSNQDRYSFAFNIIPDKFRDSVSGAKILDR